MASYPTTIASFATHNTGDTIQASDVNNPNAEIVAVETGLLNGFQHNLKPLSDNTYDLGTSSLTWRNVWTKGTVALNNVAYTFPAADGASGQFLQTNGSKTLSWNSAISIVQQFRLTLTTATPVTSGDVTAATTLYFTPYKGRRCTTFDASGNATTLTSAEISIAVPATTSQMYDVFVYNNSGTLTLELLAWTNDTTRATAIVLTGGVDAAGIYTKSGDTTRRYVGSFRTTTVSGQTEDSAVKRYVWNNDNRVDRYLFRVEATATWTYTTATFRQANGAAANQVDLVCGLSEDVLDLVLAAQASNSGTVAWSVGFGEDSTSSLSAFSVGGTASTLNAVGSTQYQPMTARLTKIPPIGRHFYAWLEASVASNTTTWYGTPGVATAMAATQNGISGVWHG